MALSLTEYNTSAAAAIAAGSKVEIAGAFFQFPADETPTGWTAITTGTTAYIALTASGTAGSQVVNAGYVSTAPTWRDDLQGWYASAASSVRIVASVYKAEATSYGPKYLYTNSRDNRWIGKTEIIATAGAGTWTCPSGVRTIKVYCIGGGGGAKGCATGQAAGGGAGGSVAVKTFNVDPGSVYSYIVGSGGTSVTTISGLNTTFTVGSTTITGSGGGGGSVGSGIGEGGIAINATGGDANFKAQDGGTSYYVGGTSNSVIVAGAGGGNIFGVGWTKASISGTGLIGAVATGIYGCGGGGNVSVSVTVSPNAGQTGAIIIEY